MAIPTADDRTMMMNRLLSGQATLDDATYEERNGTPAYAAVDAGDTAVTREGTGAATRIAAPMEVDGEPLANSKSLALDSELEWAQKYREVVAEINKRNESVKDFQQSNPSGHDLFMAAMENHNPLASWIVREPLPELPPLADYSPYDKKSDGTTDIDGYEQHYEAFVDSTNPQTTAIIRQRIDREINNQKTLANGGGHGILATIAAGVADPINLATMLMTFGAGGVASVATKTAAAGVASVSMSEAMLHATQETRTAEETALNAMATAVLAGTLGGAVGYLNGAAKTRAFDDSVNSLRHASAAQNTFQITASGGEIVTNMNPLNRIAAAMSKITPLGRTLQSENQYVRSVVQELAETNIRVEGDYVPTAVESLIKLDYAKHAVAVNKVRNIQNQWAKETGLDSDTFSIELVSAMRRGDKHQHQLIENAAKILRSEIDDLWERAAAQKIRGTYIIEKADDGTETIVPYRSSTAESYVARRYDIAAVKADPEGFKQAWIAGLKDQRARANAQKQVDGDTDLLPDLHPAQWDEIANDIYDKVIDLHVGDLHFNTAPSGATAFKQRVDVSDSFLESYLVKDWETLMEGYVKSVAPRVRLAERFGGDVAARAEGDFMMQPQIARIKKQYGDRIRRLNDKISAATGKEKKDLQKKADALQTKMVDEVRDVEIMRDRLLNITQEPSMMNPENRGVLSALRAARSWNIVTMLSNVVISSVPDLARAITYNGGAKFARAFTKSAFTKDIRRSNMPASDMAKIASAMERTSAYRLQSVTEVEDGIVYTRADKYAHWAADKVLTFSGMKHWNSMQKTIIGHLWGDRLARALIDGTDTPKLKQMGLTDDMITEARDMARLHASDDDGLFNLGLERWSNRSLIETIEAAAIKEADSLIVTPTAGDKPILMTTEIGRTIGQFKSFMISATNKMLLPLTQEKGIRPWAEVMTAIGLGAGVYHLKAQISGREPSDDPQTVLVEAVENTGLAGYAMELFKLQQATFGFDPLGKEDQSKFYSRGPWGTVLGPSAGTAQNVWKATNTNTSPEQRAKAMRKLMPFQNHFLLRKGFDAVESEAAKAIPDLRDKGATNDSFN